MIRKKIYAVQNETGYIVYVKYSLFGITIYIKEKHIEYARIDYSDF